MAEWFKAPVLKTGGARKGSREFESHPFRQFAGRHVATAFPLKFEAVLIRSKDVGLERGNSGSGTVDSRAAGFRHLQPLIR